MSSPTPLNYCAVAIAGIYIIATIYETPRDFKDDMMQVVETTKKYGKTLTTLGLGVGFVGIFYMMYKEKREQTRLFKDLTDAIGDACQRYRIRN